MGSAAAYHLARRGLAVIGVEQHGIAHALGSSHGDTRVIRKAYFEHPSYVPLLERAYAAWDALEAESQTPLFTRCGVLLAGPADGAVISGVRSAAALHGVRVETLAAAELPDGFAVEPGWQLLLEPDAGMLAVEEAVRVHARLAEQHGAKLFTDCRADGWGSDGRRAWLDTDRGRIEADKLVVCAGPWSGQLLSDLGLPLEVRRKVLLWLRSQPGAYSLAAGTPVFGFHSAGRFFYGFPSTEPGVVKVALHSGGEAVAAPDQPQRNLKASDLDEIKELVRAHLPLAEPEVVRHAVCMYTMTPDEHFVVDRHPRFANVAFAAGLSGHGFKMASVIGEALADLAADGSTQLPIEFLSASRFAH
jgi:sarcosine oxidase